MQEFSSISVSTYSPDDLTGQLSERAREGWSVVAIVPTGSTVTAYLSRAADHADESATAAEPAAAEPAAPEPDASEPDAMAATSSESEHFEVASVAAAPEPAAAEPAAPEPAPEPAAAAAPAGWYADPSSRFELRYWDGSTWTEHVSRGGQQFTDPPVA